MKRVHIFIWGIVQGVGFRYFVEKHAKMLNLNGYARNIYGGERDMQVEAVFEGDEKSVDEMLGLCHKGHLFSQVKNVEITEEEEISTGKFSDFKILR